MWFSHSHCFYSWVVWRDRLANVPFGLVSCIRSDRFKIKHSECLRMLLFNSNTALKCLSLPQCCMMMRINGVSLSLSLFFSTSLCLNRMLFLDPLNLLSRHTRDSAHNPVPPHRPGGRWQPAHRSDLLRQRHLYRRVLPEHAIVATTKTNGWPRSRCFQRQNSARFNQSLDNISCLHLLIITAHERLVWLSFDVSVLESFGRSESPFVNISHYSGERVCCDRCRQSKEDFQSAAFKYQILSGRMKKESSHIKLCWVFVFSSLAAFIACIH